MIYETRALAADGDAISLNPFAFWPDRRSRLVGFGGREEGDNPDYAFHTRYTACGSGPIVFTVAFVGLAAQRGTLILRLHELPEVMGAHARQIALSQTQLTDLIRGSGTVSLPGIARQGHHYALLGHIYGDTIATADRVSIELERRAPDPNDPAIATRHRAQEERVGIVAQIVGQREGTIVTPVSQLCTSRQLAEPLVAALLEQMGEPVAEEADPLRRWELAYLARVLDRYDVARAGAVGLGIGALGDPLGDWVAKHGCVLTLTSRADPSGDLLLPANVTAKRLDPTAVQGVVGFDFAWATREGGVGGGDRQLLLAFIEDVLRALKAGGLFTLVVPVDVAPREVGDDGGTLIRRADIDRIVLVLLSRGHQVAQLCPWGEAVAIADNGETLMVSAFGLVIRKAA